MNDKQSDFSSTEQEKNVKTEPSDSDTLREDELNPFIETQKERSERLRRMFEEQKKIMREKFPEVNLSDADTLYDEANGILGDNNGFVAILPKITTFFKNGTYAKEIRKLINRTSKRIIGMYDILKENEFSLRYYKDDIDNIVYDEEEQKRLEKLESTFPGDIIVVPIKFPYSDEKDAMNDSIPLPLYHFLFMLNFKDESIINSLLVTGETICCSGDYSAQDINRKIYLRDCAYEPYNYDKCSIMLCFPTSFALKYPSVYSDIIPRIIIS